MPLAFQPPLYLEDVRTVARRDHVCVPDGRVGEVIGFYRNEEDLVLVLFEGGERRRYARTDLRLLTD